MASALIGLRLLLVLSHSCDSNGAVIDKSQAVLGPCCTDIHLGKNLLYRLDLSGLQPTLRSTVWEDKDAVESKSLGLTKVHGVEA